MAKLKFVKISVIFICFLVIIAGSSFILAAQESVTLNIIGNNHNNTLIFIRKLIPEFEKETGIKVKVDLAGDSKMKAFLDIKSKKGFYDIIAFDSSNLPEYLQAKVLIPLDSYIKRDNKEVQWNDVLNCGRMLGTWEGKVYGVPSNIQIWMMMSRKDILDAAGLPGAPQTWDELYQYGKKLTNPQKKQYGFVTQCAKTWNSMVHSFWAIMVGFGGTRVTLKNPPKDYTPILNGPIPTETLKFYQKFFEIGPPGMNVYTWDDAIRSYSKGESVIYPIYSDAWSIFEDPSQSQVVGKSIMTTQPYYPGRPESKKMPFGGWSWGISSLSKKKEAAWKLLKWMIKPETTRKWIAAGGVPMRISELKDPEIQKLFPWAKYALERELAALVDTDYRPRFPGWAMIETIFGEELSLYCTGAKTAEQALADGNQRLKEYLIVQGYPVLSK